MVECSARSLLSHGRPCQILSADDPHAAASSLSTLSVSSRGRSPATRAAHCSEPLLPFSAQRRLTAGLITRPRTRNTHLSLRSYIPHRRLFPKNRPSQHSPCLEAASCTPQPIAFGPPLASSQDHTPLTRMSAAVRPSGSLLSFSSNIRSGLATPLWSDDDSVLAFVISLLALTTHLSLGSCFLLLTSEFPPPVFLLWLQIAVARSFLLKTPCRIHTLGLAMGQPHIPAHREIPRSSLRQSPLPNSAVPSNPNELVEARVLLRVNFGDIGAYAFPLIKSHNRLIPTSNELNFGPTYTLSQQHQPGEVPTYPSAISPTPKPIPPRRNCQTSSKHFAARRAPWSLTACCGFCLLPVTACRK